MVRHIGIVSLSAGVIGEASVRHEVEIGLARLKDYGIQVSMMPHAMSGIAYVKDHPKERAEDLLQALQDPSIDMILCAVGGDDTYRLLPYLFDHEELAKAAQPKIFLGFSDTTINHLMFHRIGFPTFYGQAFLPDVCELEPQMLPYSKRYFEELIRTGTIHKITPSDVWYDERTDWSAKAAGTGRVSHPNEGFRLLQGEPVFSGEILGGCIESLFDLFDSTRYAGSAGLCQAYGLFPPAADWQGKILLLETCEELSSPAHYRLMLETLGKTGVFDAVSGILCGKPMNGKYQAEYEHIIVETVGRRDFPIVSNINIGHATPRCIIPFGVPAVVNAGLQEITFSGRGLLG
ncbi:MAG TPA: carboxypeptidase [Lachnospiraceae bacterium]|nr:carboxypeptidase [Lachnospiraceae bacterium]